MQRELLTDSPADVRVGGIPECRQPSSDLGSRIRAIADALASDPAPAPNPGTPSAAAARLAASLDHGTPGYALLFAYLARWSGQAMDAATAVRLIESAAERVVQTPMPPSFYGGLAGAAWVMAHLHRHFIDLGEELFAGLDGRLLDAVGPLASQHKLDLVSGVVGLGVYGLERLPHERGHAIVRRVVEVLARTAETRGDHLDWLRPPSQLPSAMRDRYAAGVYDLGVAHGTAGIVALLARIAMRTGDASARDVLARAAHGLAARAREEGDWRFPHFVTPEGEPLPARSRLAWCYGDLGAAVALRQAGQALADSALLRLADDVALAAAARPFETSGVVDGGLCHGAAGVTHLFRRLAQDSSHELLSDARDRWLERTLALHDNGRALGGYGVRWIDDDGERMLDDAGFLTGGAGVALALLAAIDERTPAWDAALLAAVPAQEEA